MPVPSTVLTLDQANRLYTAFLNVLGLSAICGGALVYYWYGLTYAIRRSDSEAAIRRLHLKRTALAVVLMLGYFIVTLFFDHLYTFYFPHRTYGSPYPIFIPGFALWGLMTWFFFGSYRGSNVSWVRDREEWQKSRDRREWLEWAKRQPEILAWAGKGAPAGEAGSGVPSMERGDALPNA